MEFYNQLLAQNIGFILLEGNFGNMAMACKMHSKFRCGFMPNNNVNLDLLRKRVIQLKQQKTHKSCECVMIINMHIYFTNRLFIDCLKMIANNVAARLHGADLKHLTANTSQF